MSRVELDDVRGAALRPLGVWGTVALVLCTTGALPARAAPPGGPSAAPSTLPPVEVVAPAPLPGGAVPTAWLPTNVQSASGADLARAQATNLGEFLDAAFAGVHAASSQSNPFQLDLAFRGIGVSPLLGSANGLAVLVDGVRVNESFGDVVLWDLVPTFAIDTVQLVPGASPAFGPNALGGSLLVRSRSGRTSPGLGAALAGGSFGRERAELTYGGTRGAFDAFVGAGYGAEDGWRDRSPTEVRQFHAQGGWSGDDARLSASYTRAANRLAGNGLAPEALLAADPDAVYTWPDVSRPELDFGRLAAEWRVGDVALDAHAYLRRLDLGTENGDVEFDDGDTPADASDDGYEAELRGTRTRSRTHGFALQAALDAEFGGLRHRLVLGGGLDRGRTLFLQSEAEGELGEDRGVRGDGPFELETDLLSTADYASLYATHGVSFGARAHARLALRWNEARIRLADRTGLEPDLNGDHRFDRLNPAFGFTWAATPRVALHAGWSQGFRVPTPAELTCASPDDPCALPVAFVADPPLDPVIARSWEFGLRGESADASAVVPRAAGTATPGTGRAWRWRATAWRTSLRDDILFTAVGAGRGFFANFPSTRRQGLELALAREATSPGLGAWRWQASYAFVDSTYRVDAALFNPVALDADPATPATLDVRAGDRLPATPRHLTKVALDWEPRRGTTFGLDARYVGRQFLRGDDSNLARPLPGLAVLDLRLRQRLAPRLVLQIVVDNVLDVRRGTVGALARDAFDGGEEPLEGVGPGPVRRFVSPLEPRAIGVELRYGIGEAG